MPELLIASSVFVLLVAAILGASLYGMRTQQIVEPRLSAEDGVRQLRALVSDHIQSAVALRVGNGGATTVTVPPFGQARLGNALEVQLNPDGGTLMTVRYFVDSGQLWVSTNGEAAAVLLDGVATNVAFRSVTHLRTVRTNDVERATVEVTLPLTRIRQFESSLPVGENEYFKENVIQFVANQRAG